MPTLRDTVADPCLRQFGRGEVEKKQYHFVALRLRIPDQTGVAFRRKRRFQRKIYALTEQYPNAL